MTMFKWRICPTCNRKRRVVAETLDPPTVSFDCGHGIGPPSTVDFTGKTCEETTGMIGDTYLRCGEPASVLVQHIGRNEGPYFMCGRCANHNVTNRGGAALAVKVLA